jgi:hypothetical protein
MTENDNGNAGGNTGAGPELVQVEIDGKAVRVEKGAENLLMTQKDYTRKTQELAEQRKSLETEKQNIKQRLEAGETVLGFLSSNETAAQVMEALATNDPEKARKLLSKSNGDDDDPLADMKKELASLKAQLQTKVISDDNSERKKQQYLEAKKIASETYGLDIDNYYPEMEKIAKSNANPFIPWLLNAAKDDLIKKAEEQGKLKGKKEALEEYLNKAGYSPTLPSGSGDTTKFDPNNQRSAATAALKDLIEKKERGAEK